jgi:hypothetical protein
MVDALLIAKRQIMQQTALGKNWHKIVHILYKSNKNVKFKPILLYRN